MNKLVIPSILVATVLVAGIFAFAPVNQVSTVHTTLQQTIGTAQEDSLVFTTATVDPAIDFAVTVDGNGTFTLTQLYLYWDTATFDEANDDSESLTVTTCTLNDDEDSDIVWNFTDILLGGDDDPADIVEQSILETIDVPEHVGNGIIIGASDSFDCSGTTDTNGSGVDGFIFTVRAFGHGAGTMSVTSTDSTP